MARILKDYPSVALNPEDLDGKIDFVRIFGRPGPVHIEIGSGRATFLLNQAMAQPDVNFLPKNATTEDASLTLPI